MGRFHLANVLTGWRSGYFSTPEKAFEEFEKLSGKKKDWVCVFDQDFDTWTIHEGKAMPTWISECINKNKEELS